jgi:hypothetical protein
LTQAKQDLRNIQHKFQKIVGEKQLSAQVPYSYKLCGRLVIPFAHPGRTFQGPK